MFAVPIALERKKSRIQSYVFRILQLLDVSPLMSRQRKRYLLNRNSSISLLIGTRYRNINLVKVATQGHSALPEIIAVRVIHSCSSVPFLVVLNMLFFNLLSFTLKNTRFFNLSLFVRLVFLENCIQNRTIAQANCRNHDEKN